MNVSTRSTSLRITHTLTCSRFHGSQWQRHDRGEHQFSDCTHTDSLRASNTYIETEKRINTCVRACAYRPAHGECVHKNNTPENTHTLTSSRFHMSQWQDDRGEHRFSECIHRHTPSFEHIHINRHATTETHSRPREHIKRETHEHRAHTCIRLQMRIHA